MESKSLISTIEDVFKPCGLKVSELVVDKESTAYHACSFQLNQLHVIFRHAKVTPKKTGQFVTLWKRSADGPIEPLNFTDSFDLVVIAVQSGNNNGQFVFPKQVLIEKRIIAHLKKEGKRGFRIYPPWDHTTNLQAQKTQKWQLDFFLKIDQSQFDIERAKSLYLK